VLLGRGGSDLTALFLAKNLEARCRLLKDVDVSMKAIRRSSRTMRTVSIG
jgi:aspartokinase